MRKKIKFSFIMVILIFFNINSASGKIKTGGNLIDGVRATVIDILSNSEKEIIEGNRDLKVKEQKAEVLITSGSYKGEKLVVENIIDDSIEDSFILNKGDNILISIEEKDGKIAKAYIYEFVRDKYLVYLTVLFIVLMIAIGGFKGLKSVLTLILTIIITIGLLPILLIKGYDPIITSLAISFVITIINLTTINGFNRKTIAAIIGTSGGIAASGSITLIMNSVAKLSIYGSEEGQMMIYSPQNINLDYRGFLFSAILIGALGALMNISMSIASAMKQIEEVNPNVSTFKLIKSGMSVGRDIMCTMCNTLILAYIGASLLSVTMLITYNVSFFQIINQSFIATEIVRALAGSIGLIATIPITVITSGILRNNEVKRNLRI